MADKQGKSGRSQSSISGGIIIGVVVIVASLIFGSFTTIPAGHRGVVIRFSAVTGGILDQGLRTKLPLIDSVVKMSVQPQKYEADSLASNE